MRARLFPGTDPALSLLYIVRHIGGAQFLFPKRKKKMKEWSKGSSWSHGCSPSCSCPHCPSLEEKPATCSFQVPLGAGVCTPVVPFACCLRGKFLVTGKCELSGYLICAVAPLLQADALCLCKFSLYSVNTSVEATYCIVKKKKMFCMSVSGITL